MPGSQRRFLGSDVEVEIEIIAQGGFDRTMHRRIGQPTVVAGAGRDIYLVSVGDGPRVGRLWNCHGLVHRLRAVGQWRWSGWTAAVGPAKWKIKVCHRIGWRVGINRV